MGGRPGGGPRSGFDRMQSGGSARYGVLGRYLGNLSTLVSVGIVSIGALFGLVATIASGKEPGTLLGVFVAIGGIAAAVGIQRAKAYLLFPAPALAMFVAAILAGKVHDAKLGSSTAATGIGLAQWIADMFLPGVIATVLVVLIGGGRWLLGRQLVTGGGLLFGASRPGPGSGRPRPAFDRPRPAAPKPPRRPVNNDPGLDDWAGESPFGEQQVFKTSMMPRLGRKERPQGPSLPGNGQRGPRQRDEERDQWGDPRPGPRPRPNGGGRPGGGPPPGGAPRPSFNPQQPGNRPQQGNRPPQGNRRPPENWDGR